MLQAPHKTQLTMPTHKNNNKIKVTKRVKCQRQCFILRKRKKEAAKNVDADDRHRNKNIFIKIAKEWKETLNDLN